MSGFHQDITVVVGTFTLNRVLEDYLKYTIRNESPNRETPEPLDQFGNILLIFLLKHMEGSYREKKTKKLRRKY